MNIFIINPRAGNKKGVELIPSLMNLDDTLIHVTKNKGEAITFLYNRKVMQKVNK